MAGATGVGLLGAEKILERHLTGFDRLAEFPNMGAAADLLAPVMAVEHGSAGHANGRQIAAGRAHQQGRRGLVAADQQHHAIHRQAADRFLDIH